LRLGIHEQADTHTQGVGLPDRPEVMKFSEVLVLSVDALDPGLLAEMVGSRRAAGKGLVGGRGLG
jgi:DNA helicase TIP49 (TBP-interacting protein)